MGFLEFAKVLNLVVWTRQVWSKLNRWQGLVLAIACFKWEVVWPSDVCFNQYSYDLMSIYLFPSPRGPSSRQFMAECLTAWRWELHPKKRDISFPKNMQTLGRPAGPVGVPLRCREGSRQEAEERDGKWEMTLQWRERRCVACCFPRRCSGVEQTCRHHHSLHPDMIPMAFPETGVMGEREKEWFYHNSFLF